MGASTVALLIATALAVVVIAGYLIAISLILRRVFGRLEIILGAVSEVVEKTAPAGEVIGAINADLAAGQGALGAAVERLAERTAGEPEEPAAPSAPPATSRWFPQR